MKVDREAKKSKNPMAIETAKEVEWYLRNDRKLETARSNFITISQQSYVSAKECIKLRYDYLLPILDMFSKNMIGFFNGVNSAVMTLPEVSNQIEKGKQIQHKRDIEEKFKELRIEEAKLRKLQEMRNQLEREREEEKQDKELENKGAYSVSLQTYNIDITLNEDLRTKIKCIPTEQGKVAHSNANSYKQEFSYYNQPRSKVHYEQVRSRGDSFLLEENEEYKHNKAMGRSFCDEWEDSSPVYNTTHAFVEFYSKPYQESGGRNKPRNPFKRGGYAKPIVRPPLQSNQYNFFS
jgi:hypothetical protein